MKDSCVEVEGESRADELGGDSVDSASDDEQDALQSIAAVDSLILEGCGCVRNYHFSSFKSSAILHYDDEIQGPRHFFYVGVLAALHA